MVLPRQLVGRGSPPTSPVALLLAFRSGAPSGPLLRVFALSLRDGVTLSGRGLFQISIETKTCLAHLPLWLVSGLRDGITHFGSSGSFLALDRNEGFLHSSILSCFAMGSPGGSSVWFPALDRNEAVFG